MKTAIEVHELRKSYKEIKAVDGITFSVNRGEIFGLLGPNGAGKTTTVECLLGLRAPDGGEVQLLGMKHASHSQAIRTRLGVQLQTTGLLPQLTVREQVDLFGRLFPQARPTDEILELVNMNQRAAAPVKSLSGGQKQRLAVALALVNDPDLIFLDEPTTGLDPQARRRLWEVMDGLRQAGKTILLTTHYMEEAEQLCDRVAIIDHGRIIALDSPESLINHHFRETAVEFTSLPGGSSPDWAALPGVTQTFTEDEAIILYSTDVPQTMAGLFALVSSQAIAFKDMRIRQATLEDLFLKLTGRRIRE